MGIHPPVITPNGDGINDQVHIEYTVLKLVGAGAVEVAILDLSDRRVRWCISRLRKIRPISVVLALGEALH